MSESKGVEARREDLESGRWSFSAERFEAVVVTNFLHRPRLDLLAGLLAPGGRLIYETFARGNERYGKPSNPSFLLQPTTNCSPGRGVADCGWWPSNRDSWPSPKRRAGSARGRGQAASSILNRCRWTGAAAR